MSDADEPTVIELAESVRRGERKAVEVLDDYLTRIEAGNERLNAFVHLDADLAREAASAVDEAVARGDDPGPLAGVPFGVKDLERCKGMPTDYGSVPFAGRGPEAEDDINVARLKAAGAVAVGKTSTPEFGTLNFTKTKVHGITRNPWDTTRTPGGSSGGTAAAVAAGIIPFGTASDGGGSIRIPASFTGLLGHKCSHGRIPIPGPDREQHECPRIAHDDGGGHRSHPRRARRSRTTVTGSRCRHRRASTTRTRSRQPRFEVCVLDGHSTSASRLSIRR